MQNNRQNQFDDIERVIAEISEKTGKQKAPGVLSIVLLAGLSSGILSIGTKYVDPIDPRPDPYTGTQGVAEKTERQNKDSDLQRQINRIRESQKEERAEHKEDHAAIHDDVEWLKQQVWGYIGVRKNTPNQ